MAHYLRIHTSDGKYVEVDTRQDMDPESLFEERVGDPGLFLSAPALTGGVRQIIARDHIVRVEVLQRRDADA
jgi:hypothetical protein